MEATEPHFQSVHVLRHTFRPSLPLASQLDKFVIKGSTGPFLLASTREVAVDGFASANYRYDLQVLELEKRFHEEAIKVAIDEVRYKNLGSGALQLLFIPSEQMAFNTLTQPIDELPSLVERPESMINFGMVTTLERKKLVGGVALKEAWSELRAVVGSAGLSYAIPDHITGPDRILQAPSAPQEWPRLVS